MLSNALSLNNMYRATSKKKRDASLPRSVFSYRALPDTAGVFVTDEHGAVRYKRNIDRYGVTYPCIVKFVHEKQRKECLFNVSAGIGGIYTSCFGKDEFFTVSANERWGRVCVAVSLSDRYSESLDSYKAQLNKYKQFLGIFSKTCIEKRLFITVGKEIDSRIAAVRAFKKFLASFEKKHKNKGVSVIDVTSFASKLNEYTRLFLANGQKSIKWQIPHVETVVYIPNGYSITAMYVIAFLLRNSDDGRIDISVSTNESTVQISFKTASGKSDCGGMYYDSVTKALNTFDTASCIYRKNGLIFYDVTFNICDKAAAVQTSAERTKVMKKEILSEGVSLAFRLISGLSTVTESKKNKK